MVNRNVKVTFELFAELVAEQLLNGWVYHPRLLRMWQFIKFQGYCFMYCYVGAYNGRMRKSAFLKVDKLSCSSISLLEFEFKYVFVCVFVCVCVSMCVSVCVRLCTFSCIMHCSQFSHCCCLLYKLIAKQSFAGISYLCYIIRRRNTPTLCDVYPLICTSYYHHPVQSSMGIFEANFPCTETDEAQAYVLRAARLVGWYRLCKSTRKLAYITLWREYFLKSNETIINFASWRIY